MVNQPKVVYLLNTLFTLIYRIFFTFLWMSKIIYYFIYFNIFLEKQWKLKNCCFYVLIYIRVIFSIFSKILIISFQIDCSTVSKISSIIFIWTFCQFSQNYEVKLKINFSSYFQECFYYKKRILFFRCFVLN